MSCSKFASESNSEAMRALCLQRGLEYRDKLRAEINKNLRLIEENSRPRADKVQIVFPGHVFPMLNVRRHVVGQIMDYIKSVKDVLAATTASSMFGEELCAKRVVHSLPEVLSILEENKHLGVGETRLDLQDIQNLRLVSKSWKEIVGSALLEKNVDEFSWCRPRSVNFQSDLKRNIPNCMQLILKDVPGVLNALRKYDHGSPFVRNIKVLFINPHGRRDRFYETALKDFFDVFGTSIWHLTVNEPHSSPLSLAYKHALELLEATKSNLKSLTILLPNPTYYPVNLIGLPETIKQNPFIAAPSLKLLLCQHVPHWFSSEILRVNRNIKHLGLKCQYVGHRSHTEPLRPLYVPRVPQSLPLEMLDLDCRLGFENIEEVLREQKWPLKIFQIQFVSTGSDGEIIFPPARVFKLVQQFKNTLVEFHAEHIRFGREFGVKLDLPNLRRLTLTLTCDFNQMDFLLPLQCLEVLILGIWEINQLEQNYMLLPDPNEKLQIKGFLLQKKMMKSNIWDVFRSLMVLETRAWMPHTENSKIYSKVRYERKGSSIACLSRPTIPKTSCNGPTGQMYI